MRPARERFVRRAAATFANDPYPRPVDEARAYEANVLEPMQQVREMMDRKLRDATVPEKMEFFRYLGQRRTSLPEEAVIPVAISLLLVSMIPGSDMNY